MQINDDAVEAAAEVLNRLAGMEPGEELARAVLEAAAPYIKTEAWDEGYEIGRAPRHQRIASPNPYRSQE